MWEGVMDEYHLMSGANNNKVRILQQAWNAYIVIVVVAIIIIIIITNIYKAHKVGSMATAEPKAP